MLALRLFLPVVLGVFGAVVGSFLNVVIFRLPREDLSVFRPVRSFCPSCARQIPWYENVPILGWIFLGGRCRGCKAAISARYVIVEVLTALFFGAYTFRWLQSGSEPDLEGLLVLGAGLFLLAAAIVVTFIDLEFKIIPDEITWPGMGVGVLFSLLAPALHGDSWAYQRLLASTQLGERLAALCASGAGLLAGALIVWLVGWLGGLVFRKEAMGLGDVKYMGMVGAFLGVDGILLVFFLGCITGAVGGLVQRAITGARYIAFGPYLSLAVIVTVFYRRECFEVLLIAWPRLVRQTLGLE